MLEHDKKLHGIPKAYLRRDRNSTLVRKTNPEPSGASPGKASKRSPAATSSKGPMDMHDYMELENEDKIIRYAHREAAATDLNNTHGSQFMFTTNEQLKENTDAESRQ